MRYIGIVQMHMNFHMRAKNYEISYGPKYKNAPPQKKKKIVHLLLQFKMSGTINFRYI